MIELTADQRALQAVARALKAEENGTKLRRDLAKELRKALEPAKQDVKANLMGMSSAGLPRVGPPLRATVLSKMQVNARLSGRQTGARLRIRKTGMPRGFDNAPKRLNRKKGWRHPVIGTYGTDRETWVRQTGEPEYFDRATRAHRARYRAAVKEAMAQAARRITRRV